MEVAYLVGKVRIGNCKSILKTHFFLKEKTFSFLVFPMPFVLKYSFTFWFLFGCPLFSYTLFKFKVQAFLIFSKINLPKETEKKFIKITFHFQPLLKSLGGPSFLIKDFFFLSIFFFAHFFSPKKTPQGSFYFFFFQVVCGPFKFFMLKKPQNFGGFFLFRGEKARTAG